MAELKSIQELERLILQLETNLGLPHKQSPFEGGIQQGIQQVQQNFQVKEQEIISEPFELKQYNYEEILPPFTQLEIRVGRIVKAWKHPESENLYCEEIDIGEAELRQIASGLQKHISIDQMSGFVLVCTNLKPRKLANFMSNGMVLCASNIDKSIIEIVRPCDNCKIGERIFLEGKQDLFSQERQQQLNPKKKIWETCSPYIQTSSKGLAIYGGLLLQTSQGPIQTNLKNVQIS